MRNKDLNRDPCPWRIVDDCGGAFAFGLGGGMVYHFFGGLRNAPKGQRTAEAISRVKARVPILAGSFAIWGLFYSIFDCSISAIRRKEDIWNAVLSGAATGGVLAARAGVKAFGKNALTGGIALGVIEGLNIVVTRIVMPRWENQQRQVEIASSGGFDYLEPPVDPLRKRYKPSEEIWQPQQASPFTSEGFVGINKNSDFDKPPEETWSPSSSSSESSSNKKGWLW